MSFSLRDCGWKTEVNTLVGTPNPTWCDDKPLSTCNVHLLLFWEAKGENRAASLTLQSRCERGKMRVLIGLLVHGILQTQQKSQVSLVPSRRFIGDHASQFSKLRVRMHCSTLHRWNSWHGVEPRTSTTVTSGTAPMPTPHVASFLVSCYVSAQLERVEIGLHQLHWTFYLTEPIPLHTKTNPVEQQFPVHLQLNESKVRLSCSGDFD